MDRKEEAAAGVLTEATQGHAQADVDPITTEKEEALQFTEEAADFALRNDQNGEVVAIHEAGSSSELEKALTQTSRDKNDEPAIPVFTAVDWAGQDDPDDPMNWPLRIRTYQAFATGALAFAVTAGTSLVSPATDDIAVYFGVSPTAAVLPISLFVLGLASGPIVGAPISETYGRGIVYKVTGVVYMLFLIGAGFSQSFGSLLVCRLFAGIAGSPVLAVGAGTNADMFPLHIRGVATSYFILMPFLGTALAPIIGGFAAQYQDWRWTQWYTLFIGLVAYAFVLPMRETYKKIILARRAKRLNTKGPAAPAAKGLAYAKVLITITLLRPLYMVATEFIVFFISLYSSFTFGVLFGFFSAFPYVFGKVYYFNTWQSGLAFIGILVGVVLAGLTGFAVDRTLYRRQHLKALQEGRTKVMPEYRLYGAMMGSLGLPIGLFWFAWTARPDVHWISPILAGIPFGWGNLAVFTSAAMYLVDVYGPLNGASAMAANGLMRYILGAGFPLFTVQMYERLTIPWATSLLGFVSIAMIPIPWVLFTYGPTFRAKSKFDTVKL